MTKSDIKRLWDRFEAEYPWNSGDALVEALAEFSGLAPEEQRMAARYAPVYAGYCRETRRVPLPPSIWLRIRAWFHCLPAQRSARTSALAYLIEVNPAYAVTAVLCAIFWALIVPLGATVAHAWMSI